MKEKDDITRLFDRLEGKFDVESPRLQHRKRFLEKLRGQKKGRRTNWHYLKPIIGIAACLALVVMLFMTFKTNRTGIELARVSPEMAKTQYFYTATIKAELRKIKKHQNPKVTPLVQDAMKQLQKLEKEYGRLKKDLAKSGKDRRVIFAMISNFQNRIKVLQNLMKKIEQVKQLKPEKDENVI